VLFVPALPQTGQLLHAGMDGFRQAMTASGLNLGQAEVGGQNSGQAGGQPGQNSPHSQPNANSGYSIATSPASATTAEIGTTNGLSAYA
jgi:flagellar hook-length control protein FliK